MEPCKSFLFVHQGNELYGSDRMFAESIYAIRNAYPDSKIDVILPSKGPLEKLLMGVVSKLTYKPIWVLRKSDMKTIKGWVNLLRLPSRTISAASIMRNYDVTYINTIVIVNFLLASVFSRNNCILHVHEIVAGLAGKIFGILIRLSRCFVIYNSKATCEALTYSDKNNAVVIHNGTTLPSIPCNHSLDTNRPLRILLPGRINTWKGQDLFLSSLLKLKKSQLDRVHVRIVGDVYAGQEFFRDKLFDYISANNMIKNVEVLGFLDNMEEQYIWADVVAIPSLKPESFGMVAIEAMSYCKPVLAARHGGLCEIINDNVTGWLFKPNDIYELASYISFLCSKRELLKIAGEAARSRAESYFSNTVYRDHISNIFVQLLASHRAGK